MADLTDIYDAIAAQAITLPDNTVIRCYRLDEVPNQVMSDHLPVRLLLPPGADGGSAVDGYEYLTYNRAAVTWRVTELMLYRAIAQGGGPKNIWERLTEYIAAYVATFTAARHITGDAAVVGYQPQAAVLEWPRASGNQFHGVQMTTLVRETIC